MIGMREASGLEWVKETLIHSPMHWKKSEPGALFC